MRVPPASALALTIAAALASTVVPADEMPAVAWATTVAAPGFGGAVQKTQ